jgi:hypothetical protein
MIDRTTRVLLLAIAIGTWINVIMIKDQLNELHEIKFHLVERPVR